MQIFIELPKFVAEDTELNDERDALIYVLKNLRTMDKLPDWIRKHRDIQMICDSALFGSLSENEKEDYIMTEEKRETGYGVLSTAEKKVVKKAGKKDLSRWLRI